MDILIPTKDAVLPVLKVNIPKKIDNPNPNPNPQQEGDKKEFPFKKDFKKNEEPFQFKKP